MADPQTSGKVKKRAFSKRQMNKEERKSYDMTFKLKVIHEAKQTSNLRAGKKFGVSECNVRRWRKEEERLKCASASRRAFTGPKSGRFKDIDRHISEFIHDKRNRGFPISREVIRTKALEVARDLKVPLTEFKASIGWCNRMIQRSGLCLQRRTTLACLSVDYVEKLAGYQHHILKLRKSHTYLLGQMGIADKTSVSFDMPPGIAVDKTGSKSVLVKSAGNDNSHVTVMLAVTADGRKLPPYVVLKRKLHPKEKFPCDIIFRAQEKGWMTEELLEDWLKVVWGHRPGALLQQRGMLIINSFLGHAREKIKQLVADMNTDLVIFPGGMTLDVVVNKPFKEHLRKEYNDWLINGDDILSPAGKLKKPSIQLLTQWITTAWRSITSESIIKGFRKCGISSNIDGSEDDMIWKESDSSTSVEDDVSEEEENN